MGSLYKDLLYVSLGIFSTYSVRRSLNLDELSITTIMVKLSSRALRDLPLVKSFYATTIFKAFILNAIAVALIATFAVEIRRELNDVKGRFYLFVNPFFSGEAMTERQKAIVVALASFIGAILVYHIMYVVVGFGGGMLTSSSNPRFL